MVTALLALVIAIRLPLMSFQGYYHDLASYVSWGNTLVSQGFINLYAVKATGSAIPGDVVDPAINYPPGTPYLFGALVFLYNHTLAFVTRAPLTTLVSQKGIGPFIAKLPLLLADLTTTLLLYREARLRHSQRFALIAAASFALSPALLYNGAIWGQTDGLVALPVLLALFAILSGRYGLGGASLAIAALIKPQPVIFIPLVLLYLWRWARREDFVRFTAALLATTLLVLLPVMIPRFQLFAMLNNMQAMSYNDRFYLTQDAFNFWWLIGYGQQPLSSTFLGIKSGLVGDALFGAVALISGVKIWRHREAAYLFFGLALTLFGFFMFMGSQHERYLFLFIPLMLSSVIFSERMQSDRLIALYLAGTTLCLLNMMVGIGNNLSGRSQMIPYLTYQPLSDFVVNDFFVLSWALAAYHLATFAYAMWVFLGGRFAPLALQESPARPQQSKLSAVSLAAGVTGTLE